jgi:hypothetical protein
VKQGLATYSNTKFIQSINIDDALWYRKLTCYLLVFICFMDSYNIYGLFGPGKLMLYAAKAAIIALLPLFIYSKSENANRGLLFTILFIPFCWMYLADGSLMSNIGKIFLRVISVFPIFFLSDKERVFVVKNFITVFIWSLFPGLILQLLFLFGVEMPYSQFPHPNGPQKQFHNYFGLNFQLQVASLRFSAIYDEPGVVGTHGILMFFFFYDYIVGFKKLVLILSMLLSFSLFGNLLLLPVIFWHMWRRGERKKVVVIFISIALLITSLIQFIISYDFKDDKVKATIINAGISRLGFGLGESSNDVIFKGIEIDRAVEGNDVSLGIFRKNFKELNIEFFLGHYFMRDIEQRAEMPTLSILKTTYYYGILFILYYFLFLFIIIAKKDFLFFISCFLLVIATMWQRPLFFRLEYLAILLGGNAYNQLKYTNDLSRVKSRWNELVEFLNKRISSYF